MTAILKPPISVEQYLEFELTAEHRHEYVDGKLIQMPGESKNANRICRNLIRLTDEILLDRGLEAFFQDVKARTKNRRYRYPDFIVAPITENEDPYVVDNPLLLAEVVSPGSEQTDYDTKLAEYAEIPGLRYYLIIKQDRPGVLVYQFENGRSEVTITNGLDSTIVLPEFDLQIPLRDLYAHVHFPEPDEEPATD